MYDFGRKLKALREELGLSQSDLADILGVKRPTISQYESSAAYPSMDRLVRLAQHFRVSVDYLLGITEENRFDMDKLTDEQAEAVAEIIRQFEQANAQKRG